MTGGVALAIAALNLSLIGPASADVAPNAADIVGVGSDTVQNMANFLADGDPLGASSGINGGVRNRVFSFDATPDANDRAGYLNGSTSTLQKPLNPTIVLRAGTNPVQRPNGSSSGIKALLADPTRKINFARMSRLPTTAEQNTAVTNGWGGLHVVKISTDNLKMATALTTNAPATGLTIAQVVDIFKCLPTANNWNQFGGAAGTIIPLMPQTGSGTNGSFAADMQAANGGVAVTLGACVQFSEEHDPAAITASASPANAVMPFSEGRLNLYASGYFFNPNTPFPGAATPSVSGVKLLPGYANNRGLFMVFRDADKNSTTKWQPGTTQNFVQALFLTPAPGVPFVNSGDGQAAIAAGGGIPTYVDCGAGPAVIAC